MSASFFIVILFLVAPAFAFAGAGLTYQGRLLKSDGSAVESNLVQFKIQVRTPGNENCLLYEETSSRDMSGTKGMFAISINDGTATSVNTEPFTLDRAFQNRGTFSFGAGKCALGSTYTPNATDGRKLVVQFNDGTFSGWETLPAQAVNYVPMAIESLAVGGFTPANFLRVLDGSGNPVSLSPWTSANYTALTDLIAGSSSLYLNSSSALNGANLSAGSIGDSALASGISGAKITGNISGNAAGFTGSLSGDVTGAQSATVVTKIQGRAVDTAPPSNGQVLKWNQSASRWEAANEAGGSVTSVNGTGAIQVTGTSTDPIIGVQDASTSQKGIVQLASSGQNSAGVVVQGNDARLSDARTPTAHTHEADEIISAAGKYFTYKPNNVACGNNETLKWDGTNSRWICGTDQAGTGTVTSVGLTAPSMFSVSGGPVTTSGTIAMSLASQTANTVFAGPTSGSAAPTFRTLNIADLRSNISGPFLTGTTCSAGQALVYSAVTDTMACAALTLSSSQVTTALGYTPVNKAGDTMTGALALPSNGLTVGTNQLTVNGGNVGIGTTTPTGKFQVAGLGDGTQYFSISNPGATYPGNSGHVFEFTGYYGAQTPYAAYLDNSGAYRIAQKNQTDSVRIGYVGGVSSVSSGRFATTSAGATWVPSITLDATSGHESGIYLPVANSVGFVTERTERMRIDSVGNVGIGVTAPTAVVHLKAGSATASGAPLKFTAGTNLTTVENGAMEYDGSTLFFSAGGTRYPLAGTNSNYTSQDNAFGANQILNSVTDNLLYHGMERFTVSQTGFSALSTGVFLNGYGAAATLPAGATGVITIDLTGKGEYSAAGLTYPAGYIYLSFYSGSVPSSVSGRVMRADGTYFPMTGAVNVATSSYGLWRLTVPGSFVGLTQIEITMTAPAGASALLNSVEYYAARAGTSPKSVVSKYMANTLYDQLSLANSSNTKTAYITPAGAGYFAGNVGIATTSPSQKLEVAGNIKVSGAGNGISFPDGTTQTTAAGSTSVSFVDVARGTALSAACNADTKIIYDSKTEDAANLYSTSTGRFTPTAGVWKISASVFAYTPSAENNQHFVMAVYKNGAAYKYGPVFRNYSANTGASIDTIVRANGTDYFELYVQFGNCTTGVAMTASSSQMWMQAARLGN